MTNNAYIVIAGCGRLGSRLANSLSGAGHSVVVIDNRPASFANLSAQFSGFTILGDVTDVDTLKQAKINIADIFLATTRDDNTNLMCAQIARSLYEIPVVLARVFDPGRESMYNQLGIATICPTTLAARSFAEKLSDHLITPIVDRLL